jgi:hypothetical protein
MITNRLTGVQETLASTGGALQWQISGGTIYDGGISELSPFTHYRQLKIGVSTTAVELSLDNLTTFINDGDVPFVFLFAIKMPSGGTITSSITENASISALSAETKTISAKTASVNAEGVSSPQWSIVRFNTEIVADILSPTFNISVTIEPENAGEFIYFTRPAFYPRYEFLSQNASLEDVFAYLPELFIETDFSVTDDLDLPMFRYLDVATSQMNVVSNNAVGYTFFDISEGYVEGNTDLESSLVQTNNADLETLIWLAKFSGTVPITRFASSLETVSDAFILDSSTLDSLDTLKITSYLELNPPSIDEEDQRALVKWQIDNGYYGINAGSDDALIESAKLMLVGTKTVSLEYDYSTSPFEINVVTRWDETFGGNESLIGQSSPLVLEAVSKARPLGVRVTHEMVAP